MNTLIPPPVYALCTAGLMWLVDRYAPGLRWVGELWNVLGWGLIAIGVGVDLWAIIAFIRTRTTINPTRPDRATHLVVSGLYGFSRNPMYLGLVFSLCGWACLLGNPICLGLVWLFARALVTVQIAPEETALREKFGNAYIQYGERVHRWIGWKSGP